MKHIIYISGLGDRYDWLRKLGLVLWRRSDTKVTHIPMKWEDVSETYDSKLLRIKAVIDTYPDHSVTLVGESAGGSVAIAAFYKYRKNVEKLVTVCGMNKGEGNVNPAYYKKNPAFRSSMSAVDKVVLYLSEDEKKAMYIIYSSLDATVRPKHSLISGVRSTDLKIPGHLTSIAKVLFFNYRLITS